MNICIASRSRWQIISTLLDQFHPDLYSQTKLYVPDSQYDKYSWVELKYDGVIVRTVRDDWKLARVRVEMAQYAAYSDNQNTMIMVDDDLRLCCRASETSTHARDCKPTDVMAMFKHIHMMLVDGKYSHVATHPRMMQNYTGLGTQYNLVKECKRAMCVVGWRLDDFFDIDYGRMDARSDFDATLQSLRKGRPNLILCWWVHDQKFSEKSNQGGCADYRDAAMFDRTAHELAAYHPGLVTTRLKVNKTGAAGTVQTRTEVWVRWQKALGYG